MFLSVYIVLLAFVATEMAALSSSSSSSSSTDVERLNRMEQEYKRSRLSLQSSTWPLDHADVGRMKYTMHAGFPRNFKPEDVHRITQPEVQQAQWMYTGGKNSEYLYIVGGKVTVGCVISKVDSKTLEVLQKFQLPKAMYLGGLLMHANGHV